MFYNGQHRKLGCSKQRCEEATCEGLMNKRAQRCPVRGTRSFIQCKGRQEKPISTCKQVVRMKQTRILMCFSEFKQTSIFSFLCLLAWFVCECVCVNARAASTSTAQLERKWTSPSNELWQAVDATLLAWKRSFCLVWLTICGGLSQLRVVPSYQSACFHGSGMEVICF